MRMSIKCCGKAMILKTVTSQLFEAKGYFQCVVCGNITSKNLEDLEIVKDGEKND